VGWQSAAPGGLAVRCPGWAGSSVPRLGQIRSQAGALSRPGWADTVPRLGQDLQPPAGPLRILQAGLARPTFPAQAGIPYTGWAGFCVLFRPGQAGIPWPGPDYSSPGLKFTSSGICYPSSIDSSILCQSWDASRLGLAHSPSSYAGLGTPLGSDQHIPPLLVSLILRRRIRLMTW
jgi:hypothetical protein